MLPEGNPTLFFFLLYEIRPLASLLERRWVNRKVGIYNQ